MQKKSKLLFLLNSIFLCFTIPLFDIAFNNNDINKSLENPILNERQENHKKKQQNLIFSTYDSEEILDEDYQFTLPTKFGKFQESEYPSYYYPQEFESLDNVNTKEELNATRMGQIRIENEEILAETDAKIANNTLQKHNSADGQFFGKVEDTAKRIVKKVTINHNVSSRHSLGVFAPAGEILTVEIDEEIINKTDEKNRLTIIVGFPYRENTVHEVEKKYFQKWRDAKNRMPILFKEFVITNPVTKIGSPLGGMVFLKDIPGAIDEDFDIKISGGVNNPSYQYGVSSLSDWKDMLNSPSPYAIIQTPYLYFYAPKIYVNHIENPTNILYFSVQNNL